MFFGTKIVSAHEKKNEQFYMNLIPYQNCYSHPTLRKLPVSSWLNLFEQKFHLSQCLVWKSYRCRCQRQVERTNGTASPGAADTWLPPSPQTCMASAKHSAAKPPQPVGCRATWEGAADLRLARTKASKVGRRTQYVLLTPQNQKSKEE